MSSVSLISQPDGDETLLLYREGEYAGRVAGRIVPIPVAGRPKGADLNYRVFPVPSQFSGMVLESKAFVSQEAAELYIQAAAIEVLARDKARAARLSKAPV